MNISLLNVGTLPENEKSFRTTLAGQRQDVSSTSEFILGDGSRSQIVIDRRVGIMRSLVHFGIYF